MEITVIFIGIVFIISLVYFAIKLNSYSDEKYDYSPINFFNIALMMTPFILLACGFWFFKDNEINKYLSIIFSLIIIITNFLYIRYKTNTKIALGAILILIFAGLFFLLMLFGSSRNNNDYDHY